MKGLEIIPSQTDIIYAYNSLQFGAVNEEQVALWAQWSRLDPRLAEVLTGYLCRAWSELNPIILNTELLRQPWPSALGVLVEQVFMFSKIKNLCLFKNWARCAMSAIEPLPHYEQFFVGQRRLGGKLMFRDSFLTTEPYLKWGYLGNQILFSKYKSLENKTLIPAKTRAAALEELIKRKKRFTVSDYIHYLDGHISRRQAQLDLNAFSRLKSKGSTRSRHYYF